MATKTVCDGCACDLTDDQATLVGRYDPCIYCPECLKTWQAHEAAMRETHAKVVIAYQTARATSRFDLKASGLARLPDDG